MSDQIVSKVYRVLRSASEGLWDKVSFWTKASDVENSAGKNLQNTVGAIDGITSDVTSNSTTYAASIKSVHDLNNNLTANSNSFIFDYHNGKYGFNTSEERGADTFYPFKSFDNFEMIYEHGGSGVTNISVSGVVQPGDVLFVLLWSSSTSNLQPNRYDGATCTGGTITKISNLRNSAAGQSGTFYQVNCESNTITITHTNSFLYNVFKVNL